MKTVISIPDDTFQDAERCAEALGISRSEFFTVAARHYIDELDVQSLTSRIDAAIDLVGEDESSRTAVSTGRRLLTAETSEW